MKIGWVIEKKIEIHPTAHGVCLYNALFKIYSCYEEQSKQAGYFCGCNEIHYGEMYFKVVASHREEHGTCNEVFPGRKKFA